MWSKILQAGLLEQLKGVPTNKEGEDASQKAVEQLVNYWKNHGDLKLWSGYQAMRAQQFEQRQHQKNREAEEAHARKHVWGYEESDGDEEEMGEEFVNFGEINISQPNLNAPTTTKQPPAATTPPPNQQQAPDNDDWFLRRFFWPLAASAILGAGGTGWGVANWFEEDPPAQVQPGGSVFDFDSRPPPWIENGDK